MRDLRKNTRPAIKVGAYLPLSSQKLAAHLAYRDPVQGEGAGAEDTIVDLVGKDGKVISGAPLSAIKIDPPLGSAARKMTFPDGTVFETSDHAGIEALTGRTSGSLLHDLEQFRPRLIGIVSVCILAVWVFWRYGLDILVAAAIWITPPVVVDQIDRGTLQTIDFTMAEDSRLTEKDKQKVRDVFDRMMAVLDPDQRDDIGFTLLFRDMPGLGPNAFALPGGTIVMTDEFVEMFGQPDILAGVLGHEIGHVYEKHGLKQTSRSLGIYVLIGFMAGDTGPVIEDILLEGNLLLSLSYSRGHESDADQFGLRLSKKAGYDPSGLKQFFVELSELVGDPPQWLSTHPTNVERVKAIEAYIKTLE